MEPVKATWTVTAGVIPGEIIDEHTKIWCLTQTEYESESSAEINARYEREASEYASSLRNPKNLNWVNSVWAWV